MTQNSGRYGENLADIPQMNPSTDLHRRVHLFIGTELHCYIDQIVLITSDEHFRWMVPRVLAMLFLSIFICFRSTGGNCLLLLCIILNYTIISIYFICYISRRRFKY